VFRAKLYGLDRSEAATAPSISSSTLVTPTLSEALAVMVIVPTAVVLLAGEVIDVVGLVVSATVFWTLTVIV
jgi:hypothetical protein